MSEKLINAVPKLQIISDKSILVEIEIHMQIKEFGAIFNEFQLCGEKVEKRKRSSVPVICM